MNSLLFKYPLDDDEPVTAGLKQLDGRRMARSSSQSLVSRDPGERPSGQ